MLVPAQVLELEVALESVLGLVEVELGLVVEPVLAVEGPRLLLPGLALEPGLVVELA